METYVIAGAGLAGASAADALRGGGFEGRILLLGDEAELPYERPPLSKEFLRGEADRESLAVRNAEFYARNAIEVKSGSRVTEVDPHARLVKCADGESLAYDKLLIATGGKPRRLHVDGGDLPGVLYLRTLADSMALKTQLQARPRVLVVGGGFIGCEVASSARQLGCEVTIAGPSMPMAHALGPEAGAAFAAFHRRRGVNLRNGATVTAFRGGGRLEEAVLSDGSAVACDLTVVGIGIIPALEAIRDTDTRDGILTDEFCRTELPDVFAAGDVARSWRPRLNRHARLEHYENAQLQGAAAGNSMCGKAQAYDPVPFFWSDQYDVNVQYYGSPAVWDSVVFRGDKQQSFAAFYLQGGVPEGVCLVNRTRDANAAKRLLGQCGIDAQALSDESVKLSSLYKHEHAVP